MSRYLHLRATSRRTQTRPRSAFARASAVVLLGAISSVIAAFGLPVGAAFAASAPAVAAPRTSTFCGLAANEAKGSSVSPASFTPASLQATYTKLKSEESFVQANSPSQLKGDFTTLFTFLNKFISILTSVKYNFAKLSPAQLKTFSTADTKQVQAASKAIDAYVTNVCHVKV
jgi:hypothetical protein